MQHDDRFPHGNTHSVHADLLADVAGRVVVFDDCLPARVPTTAVAARPLPRAGLVRAERGGRRPYGCAPTVAGQSPPWMGNLAMLVAPNRPVNIAPWAMAPPRAGSTDRRRQERAAQWLFSREEVT